MTNSESTNSLPLTEPEFPTPHSKSLNSIQHMSEECCQTSESMPNLESACPAPGEPGPAPPDDDNDAQPATPSSSADRSNNAATTKSTDAKPKDSSNSKPENMDEHEASTNNALGN